MSLRRRLTFMVMGISLAAVALTVTAITAYLIYDMHNSKVQELQVTAALAGDRNGAALVFLDRERARANLEIYHMNPSIIAACIYDSAGSLFASYQTDDTSETPVPCANKSDQVKQVIPDVLTAFRDIRQGGEEIGHVFMASDTREIDTYVHKIMLISGTATALVCIVTLLMTVYFQRTISEPILELAATAQAITAKRDYTLEARANYAGETGTLARAFNDMLGEVRKRDEELVQANETLEQKVSERTCQLEHAKRKAEEASEAKSEFLRNMSHEFRTPLHAIICFSSYGLKEVEDAARDQLKQYFELIQKGSDRLSRLVNEVLDLAKLEHGEQMFLLKRGDMRDLASKSAEMVRSLLQEKNLTLTMDANVQPVQTVCDHDKIVQVVTNLLSNAIKFTPAGSRITLQVGTMQKGDHMQAVLTVIDEGVGIPEEEKETIFESFRQSSRTRTGAGGTGLGLAICRSIVEAHGGRIWAENNKDRPGARVSFAIPAITEEGKRLISPQATEASHENAA